MSKGVMRSQQQQQPPHLVRDQQLESESGGHGKNKKRDTLVQTEVDRALQKTPRRQLKGVAMLHSPRYGELLMHAGRLERN